MCKHFTIHMYYNVLMVLIQFSFCEYNNVIYSSILCLHIQRSCLIVPSLQFSLFIMQTMDEVTNVQKQRLKLQTHLQSLSVQFKQNTVQTPSSFPPIYIRMTRGSRVVESSNVPLTASTTTPGKYSAQWEGSILSMVLTVSRDVKSGRFESRDVRYQLKIYSEGKASHKTLASCRFDVTNLNLQSADCSPSAEKQQVQFNVGKNATAAISDIVLEATFQYELLPDQPTFSLEESTSITSPRSPSPSCRLGIIYMCTLIWSLFM